MASRRSSFDNNDNADDILRYALESDIRRMKDEISDTYKKIAEIRQDRAQAVSSNQSIASRGCFSYCGCGLLIIIWIILFATDHWFIAIFIYPTVAGIIGSILTAIGNTRGMHEEDISRYDREIEQEQEHISRLQREIQAAQAELTRMRNKQQRAQANNQGNGRYNSSGSKNQRTFLQEQYKILGCSPTIDDASLKRLYHDLMKAYHPDRVAAAGNDPRLVNLAEEQVKKINAAYDEILKARGLR